MRRRLERRLGRRGLLGVGARCEADVPQRVGSDVDALVGLLSLVLIPALSSFLVWWERRRNATRKKGSL